MHDLETKQKFIALRSQDRSLRSIAEELQVDKTTLVRWNRQFAADIKNLRQIEFEHLQEQLLGSQADRFKALVSDYQRYSRELESRKPHTIPQYMLFRMVCRLRDQLERRVCPPDFVDLPPSPPTLEETP